METTTHPEAKEATMDFSTTPHGLLPVGTATEHGTIAGRSFTAYDMTSGEYVAFVKVHGAYKAATPPGGGAMSRLVMHVDIDLPTANDPIEVAEELFYGDDSAYGVEGSLVFASWDTP